MNFKDTRLYELLRWIVAAAIGGCLLSGCLVLLEKKVFSQHFSDWIQFDKAQLEEKKEALLTDAYIGALEQLQEEEKSAILALPGLEQTRKIKALQISDYAKIDEVISINRQLMDINEKKVAITSALQKKRDIANYSLILFGLLLMLFSMFVPHSAIRLLLAATGTVFSLVIGVWMFHVGSNLPYSLQATIVALLLASIAYAMWHFLSKKYVDMHRYLFLQMFGAFSLAYALFAFGPTVSEYFFPSEVEKIIKSYTMRNEMRAPLLKEQRELLAHELLSKEQKDRYIELDNKLNTIDEEWYDKILAFGADQFITRFFYQKYMPISALAVLYILLGIFLSVPVLISFGLIFSGSFILLLCPLLLYLKLSFVILLSYGLFVAAMLAFVGYHLYHQRRE